MSINTLGKWLLATMFMVSTAAANLAVAQGDLLRAVADNDGDTIGDNVDNCLMLENPNQRDTDADGIGNLCDPDLNNDCMINFLDLQIIKTVFFSTDVNADFNGDGIVNFLDLQVMQDFFFSTPGPTGGQNTCTCRPPDVVAAAPNLEFDGQEMFLLGNVASNELAVSGINNFSDQDNGLYLARLFAPSGGIFNYTISNQASSVEYCGTEVLAPYAAVDVPYFGCGTAGTVQIPTAGCYEFVMRAEPGSVLPPSVELALADRLGRWEFEVDPTGGSFIAPNGVELDIPPGAVSAPVTLAIGDIPCAQVDALFAATTVTTHDNRCIGAFAGEPESFTFNTPITVRLPVSGLVPAVETPLWLGSTTGRQDYSLIPTTLSYDGNLAIVEATLDHFSIIASAGATSRAPAVSRATALPSCCSEVPTPVDCCCVTFNSTSAAGDTIGTDCDCQLVGFEIQTEFPDCPGAPIFMDSESHSSENCPTDLQAEISPADLTLWACQGRDIEANLSGTNQSGSDCNLPLPVNWSTGDPGVATVADTGPNMARVTGVIAGNTSLDVTSLVGSQFSFSAPVQIVSLEGEWFGEEAGEQLCTGFGEPTLEDDSDEGYVQLSQPDCDTLSVSVGVPGVNPAAGPLTSTDNPVIPFTFELSTTANTLGCYFFNESNGNAVDFGEPMCPQDYTCEALSCSEVVTETGSVYDATVGEAVGQSHWNFSASWRQTIFIDGDEFTTVESINCIGDSNFILFKQ